LVDKLVEDLDTQYKETTNSRDRGFVKERIANISGGVGIIYVGANSEIELKEKYDRVDDAVRAVAAAIDGGVLPGGGIALLNEAHSIKLALNEPERIATNIMIKAMVSPFKQILLNAGKDYESVWDLIQPEPKGTGLNLKTGYYGDMIEMGVVDPAKVTITALQNAVSVATTIMSSSVTITNMRSNDNA
jgi:chaperonin GroEL